MPLRYTLLGAALAILTFTFPLTAQNLVTNGDFSNGTNGWEIITTGTVSGGVLTLSGLPELPTVGIAFQCVPIRPAQRYRFASSIRVAPGSSIRAITIAGFYIDSSCNLDGNDDGSTDDGVALVATNTGAWERLETLVTSPGNGQSALVVLSFSTGVAGTAVSADFDDVVLAVDNDPRVAVVALPSAIVQSTSGGATSTFTLQNVGFSSTQITLSQSGNFFSLSPTTFTLGAGESQVVTITGLAVAAGSYEGSVIVAGAGVPAGLTVPVRLSATAPPGGPVSAAPAANRVDLVSAPNAANVTGTASFSNSGTGTLRGTLYSDVPWLIPQAGIITIPPGQTVTVTFTIDPSKRPDGGDIGSQTGTLYLEFLSGLAAKIGTDASPGAATASVVIVHTVSPGSAPGQLPPLAPGEVGLFIPGIAHAPGSVGTFISDLSLASLQASGSLKNIKLFFRPIGQGTSSLASSIPQVISDRPLFIGDIASTIFSNTSSSGTLQIRGEAATQISAAANVFNSSNPKGTFGTAIPVFRSDRSARLNEKIFLAGVRADATTHTNIYVQEAAGAPGSFRVDFFDGQGVPMPGSQSQNLEAFSLLQLGRVVPEGAVSAVVTNSSGGGGRLLAYATPVDRASGDTWAVADWNRYYGAMAGPFIVPVAGSVRGANNTYFRTDIAITNTSGGTASGELKFYSRTGETLSRAISLPAQQSRVVSDVLVNLFGLSGDQVGYLEFTPASGSVAITSRTYTTVQGQSATFGTGVPTVPRSFALTNGQLRRFGGIEDASLDSINAQRAGTFRTNVGLVEVSGQPATVRLTLKFSSGGQSSATQATVTLDVPLAARQFLQLGGISRSIMGATRDTKYGDLRNMQLDVQVIGGAGSVIVYTSSIDNGTGDSILRLD